MESFNTALLFIIACTIIIYSLWNFISNRKEISPAKLSNDIRYYELKSKYEFLVAITAFLLAFGTFYGISTKKDLEKSLRADFTEKLDSIQEQSANLKSKLGLLNVTTDKKVEQTDKTLNAYYDALLKSQAKQGTIDKKFTEYAGRIDSLRLKNLLKRNFYLVDNIVFNYDEYLKGSGGSSKTIYFNTIITSLGDRLPTFSKPPIVIALSDDGYGFIITRITSTYFTINVSGTWSEKTTPGDFKLRLLISEID